MKKSRMMSWMIPIYRAGRPLLVTVVLATLLLTRATDLRGDDSVATTQAETTKTDTTKTDTTKTDIPAQDTAQAPSAAERIADAERRLADIKQQQEALEEGSQAPDWLLLQQRLLNYQRQLLAQLETAGEQTSELAREQQELAAEMQRLRSVGLVESPPYSFLKLDELRDELAAELARSEAIESEAKSAEQLLEEIAAHRHHNESERRKAKEAVELNGEGPDAAKLQRALEEARLRSQVTQVTHELRVLELANLRTNGTKSELRATFFREQIQQVQPQTTFSQGDLDAVYAEMDRQQQRCEAQLGDLRSALGDANRAVNGIEDAATVEDNTDVGAEKAREERLTAWRRARKSRQARIGLTNQRLGELVAARYIWDYRHRVFVNTGDVEPLRDDFARVETFVERLDQSKRLVEIRMEEVRIDLATIEQKLQNAESTAEATRWLEFQREEVKRLLDDYGNNLVHIFEMQRLLAKISEEAKAKLAPDSLEAWLRNAQYAAETCWNFEVANITDKPITVKKIAGALLLFLASLVLASVLSRLLGRRILPRLGANRGAAQAMQSISFYAMVAMFSYVTLEFANVPLTVFTYFGGAMAIAVGFGSQNIINNFISGLIILAERPIRPGDLVEVKGLYGTIEHIGARSTRVKTGANLELIIPNSKFLENDVTNWTLSSTTMRTVVTVGVAYGSPTREVEAILTKVVAAHPDVHADPAPIVLFKEFADSSLSFEVHFWIHMRTIMQGQRIESTIRHDIDAALREADITIAFPQRDIHFDTSSPIEVNLRQLTSAHGDSPLHRAA